MSESKTLRNVRYFAWGAVALALIAGAMLMLEQLQYGVSRSTTPTIQLGGDFELTTQEGTRFSSASLKGRPHLVFFGFTQCPDICPTTLSEITGVLEQLGPDADKLSVLFITVDPERDTPEHLKAYMSSFDSRIIGLTGTPEQIASVAKLYRAYYEKIAGTEDADYTLNHTASVYAFNKKWWSRLNAGAV